MIQTDSKLFVDFSKEPEAAKAAGSCVSFVVPSLGVAMAARTLFGKSLCCVVVKLVYFDCERVVGVVVD